MRLHRPLALLPIAAYVAALLLAGGSAAALARGLPAKTPAQAAIPSWQRGIALGLFSEDAGFSYRPLLDEIRATGADHVELVVAWYLRDVHAGDLHDHPRYTPPPAAIERAIDD